MRLAVASNRHEYHIALTLMQSFLMQMRHIFRGGMAQRTLLEYNQPRQYFLLHEAAPPLHLH